MQVVRTSADASADENPNERIVVKHNRDPCTRNRRKLIMRHGKNTTIDRECCRSTDRYLTLQIRVDLDPFSVKTGGTMHALIAGLLVTPITYRNSAAGDTEVNFPMTRKELIDLACELVENDDNQGICIACGEVAYSVEPDARKYTCESCDQPKVYGAQELVIMLA